MPNKLSSPHCSATLPFSTRKMVIMTDEKREEKRIAIEERRKHLFEGVEPGKAT
jgi:hypothetical protein